MTAPHGAEARRIEDALGEMGALACPEFARLAKVPDHPDYGPEDFFSDALFTWLIRVVADDTDTRNLLCEVRHRAETLQQQLELLRQHLRRTEERQDNGYYDEFDMDLAIVTLKRLPPSNVERILAELSVLTKVLPRKERARSKRYPGLDVLVYELEASARGAGGGFTVHRKHGAKGTLLQALDRLRTLLLANADLKHLVKLIPPNGGHPIPLYETALEAARKDTAVAGPGERSPPRYELTDEPYVAIPENSGSNSRDQD